MKRFENENITRNGYGYHIELKNKGKSVGTFNIKFVSVNVQGYGQRIIPEMAITVENNYQRQGIAKYMIKSLLNNLTKNEKKSVQILFINTNVSPRNKNNISVWQKLGLHKNRSFGYQKSVLFRELYNAVSK